MADPASYRPTEIPELPGVYRFYNAKDKVIYVGKAKNLKNRLTTYFGSNLARKTHRMVNEAVRVDWTIVGTELEALALEFSWIKQYQPTYNVQFKDDKSYPLIKITKEAFPKVYAVRNPVKDGSEYFGPYASGKMMHTILELTQKLYPTRNCNLNLNAKTIAAGNFKVCLEYQIGNCKGPCQGLQSEESYKQTIANIKHILRGNLAEVKRHIKTQIEDAVARLAFEEAHEYKEKLISLESYQSKSTVVNNSISNVDVFGIISSMLYCYICSKSNLTIQAFLQLIYVFLGVFAFYKWGKEVEIQIRTISWKKHLLALIIGSISSFALGSIFAKNGQFLPFLDAFIAVFAIFSTFLALKGILENWIYWIILNLLSMYLFWEQGLNFSVFLFFGYALTAVYGFYQWKKELKDGQTT